MPALLLPALSLSLCPCVLLDSQELLGSLLGFPSGIAAGIAGSATAKAAGAGWG